MIGFGSSTAYCHRYDPTTDLFTSVVNKPGYFSTDVGYDDTFIRPIYLADLDGDGKKDMVAFDTNGLFMYKSTYRFLANNINNYCRK